MLKKLISSLALMGLFLPLIAQAQEKQIDDLLTDYTVWSIVGTSILIIIFVLIGITNKEPSNRLKSALFWGMSVPIVLVSIFVAGSTVYLNIISATKGPVHWHADFKIFACGEEIDLVDPTGISNKIGTPLFHEHDDLRIHVEGTVHELENVSLGSFFEVIGGSANHGELVIPTTKGVLELKNGLACSGKPEWTNKQAEIQVFVYQTKGEEVYQQKLINWPEYVMTPESVVPPGDCVIIEYTPEKIGQTDKICDFYAIELNKGDLKAANFDYGN